MLALRDLPARATFRAGVRDNDARAISAGRKVLLPTEAVRGAPNYARAGSLEHVKVQFLAPKEVRDFIEKNISYRGQGWDAKLEERNAHAKVLVGANTFKCWQFANAAQDLVPELKKTLSLATGVGSALESDDPVPPRRTPVDMDAKLHEMEGRIHAGRCLEPSSSARPPATLGGTPLLGCATGYYAAGEAKIAEILAVVQRCPDGQDPVLPSMQFFKILAGENNNPKKKSAAVASAVTVAGGEEGAAGGAWEEQE